MLRATLVILSLFLGSAPAHAGFRAAVFAYPVLSFLNVSSDPTIGRPVVTWGLGGTLEWGPTRWLGLELGFLYTNRVVGGPLGSQSGFTYGQVPFFIRFWPWRFVNIGLGGYLGYGLGNVTSTVAGTTGQLSYTGLGYTRWDWGAAGVLGFQVPLLKLWYVFIDGRMLYGFQNLEVSPVGDSKTSWLEIAIVGGFRIGSF